MPNVMKRHRISMEQSYKCVSILCETVTQRKLLGYIIFQNNLYDRDSASILLLNIRKSHHLLQYDPDKRLDYEPYEDKLDSQSINTAICRKTRSSQFI